MGAGKATGRHGDAVCKTPFFGNADRALRAKRCSARAVLALQRFVLRLCRCSALCKAAFKHSGLRSEDLALRCLGDKHPVPCRPEICGNAYLCIPYLCSLQQQSETSRSPWASGTWGMAEMLIRHSERHVLRLSGGDCGTLARHIIIREAVG